MFNLALRNVTRNVTRLKPMIALLISSFVLLFMANSILSYIDNEYASVYTNTIAGDIALGGVAKENFTLFGADTLLVGEYFSPPLINQYEDVEAHILSMPGYEDHTSIVTSAGQMEIKGKKNNVLLFGVNFPEYTKFFPELELIKGRYPSLGEQGIIIQEWLYDSLSTRLGKSVLDEKVMITVAYESNFAIREVMITGVISYDSKDPLINKLALIDLGTARGLNGYVDSTSSIDISEDHDALFDLGEEDLFASFAVESENDTDENSEDLQLYFDDDVEVAVNSGAYNFILVRTDDNISVDNAINYLRVSTEAYELSIKDWRESVGGNAVIVWVLRFVINIGLFFIIAGTATITINAIVLSILERAKEIGTMRALGASKLYVSILIFIETGIIVAGSAITGILIGHICIGVINFLSIMPTNNYIKLLFAHEPITGQLSVQLLFEHIGFAVLLLIVASIYPIKKLLQLTPRMAMS